MKKIVAISILAVFMLVAISYATAVNTNTTSKETKESPLYNIRNRRAIGSKIYNIIDNIKTKFLGNRIFFLPIRSLGNRIRVKLSDTLAYTCEEYCTEDISWCAPKICTSASYCCAGRD